MPDFAGVAATLLVVRTAWFILISTLLTLASAPVSAQDEAPVDIILEQFGVGSVYRPGDVVPARFLLTSRLTEAAVSAQVVWEVPDPRGDVIEYSRRVVLNRGVPVRLWMYARTLSGMEQSTNFTVRVYEYDDDAAERGRELAAAIVSPARLSSGTGAVPIGLSDGLFGIIGGSPMMGLDQYQYVPNAPHVGYHENTLVAGMLNIQNIPDRWFGLASFEAHFWTNQNPQNLSQDQASALREWIYRGGQFVIVLPTASDPWELGSDLAPTPLHDLLPQTAPAVDPAVPLVKLAPILTKEDRIRASAESVEMAVRTFETIDNHYQPIIALPEPDSRVVAVQRTYGFGHITVIGIDLTSGQLKGTEISGGNLPDADVFWNRILGRRQDTLREWNVMQRNNQLRSEITGTRGFDMHSGRLFNDAISLSGSAVAGLGLAFFLFIIYWIVAGPGAYFALRSVKRERHSWVGFALIGVAFTFIAWGCVWLLRDQNVRLQHVSVLDHVSRPPEARRSDEPQYQRASSWFSVYLPGYGRSELAIASDPGQHDLLMPFDPPGVEVQEFGNVARYEIPLDSEASYEVPVRATTMEMYARWTGALRQEWGDLFTATGIELERLGPTAFRLSGEITSNLPGTLRNWRMLVIEPHRMTAREYRPAEPGEPRVPVVVGQMLNVGRAWGSRAWRSGAVLDLADPLADRASNVRRRAGDATAFNLQRFFDIRYQEEANDRFDEASARVGTVSAAERERLLEMLTFYQQIPIADYEREERFSSDRSVIYKRHLGRELDLSPWLNRPCLVIIGFLENSELPIPFTVDGGEPISEGLTMVRWVYPLPVTVDDVARTPRDTTGEGQ